MFHPLFYLFHQDTWPSKLALSAAMFMMTKGPGVDPPDNVPPSFNVVFILSRSTELSTFKHDSIVVRR